MKLQKGKVRNGRKQMNALSFFIYANYKLNCIEGCSSSFALISFCNVLSTTFINIPMADFTFQYLLLFHPNTGNTGFYMLRLLRNSNIFCSSVLCTESWFSWFCFGGFWCLFLFYFLCVSAARITEIMQK